MFRIIPDGRTFREYALLRSGESVLLRTATPDDVPALERLMQTVSSESLQMRFMGAVSFVARSTIEFMCTGDPRDRLSLLALVGQEPAARVIGVGNYLALGVSGKAEVAFLVHDDFQGRGVSTLMLERLAGIAAANGFIGFEADVLPDNQAMISVFRDSGFEVVQAYEGSSIHVRFPLSGAAALRERIELRDRLATANSLLPLLAPRSAAVVGASRDPGDPGRLIFSAIMRGEFAGTVYPVSRSVSSVHGVRTYASLGDLPEAPDLAIITVPPDEVLGVAEQALRRGTKGLLVLTAGFAEAGPEGAERQRALLNRVRGHGARLIGPNCLGLQNTSPEVSLNASLAPAMAPRGHVGFYSHSAALGNVILNYAAERGLGFSTFVSAGNRADVSGNDLLEYWEEDPLTSIALLYLETFGNPRRFARIARRVTYRKPVLCVKSARSRAGQNAARAHIAASAAHSDTNVDLLFHQAGVLRADTLEEMFDVAVLLAHQPLPRGNRVAVISNSGGVLTICADACEGQGLEVTAQEGADLGPLATVQDYEAAIQRALERADVDALIAIYACVGECDPDVIARGIRRGILRAESASGLAKPALLCLMGSAGTVQIGPEGARDTNSRRVFPSYRFPESAARALARAVQYAAFRAQPPGRVEWFDDVDGGAARQEVTALLESGSEPVLRIEGDRAAALLRCFGIRVTTTASATPGDQPPSVDVTSDPSFGPLIRLQKPGGPAVVRITPLTNRDAREMLDGAGLDSAAGAEELLGRLSQMIEELPWLAGLTARVLLDRTGGPDAGATLGADVGMAFRRQ